MVTSDSVSSAQSPPFENLLLFEDDVISNPPTVPSPPSPPAFFYYSQLKPLTLRQNETLLHKITLRECTTRYTLAPFLK